MASSTLPPPPLRLPDSCSAPEAKLEKTTTATTLTRTRANLLLVFVVLSQLAQQIAFGAGINFSPILAPRLGAPPALGSWLAAAYPLTAGTFVLIGGPLGAVQGHKRAFALGAAWWVVWTVATGLAATLAGVSAMRALAGVGAGLMVPNAVALLGIAFEPGRRRNLALALFGAMGPVGAAGGSVVSGVIVQLTEWKWLFLFLGLLGLIVFGTLIIIVPADEPQLPNQKIDWIGAYLGVAGLILFNFVWNQAPFAGWSEPYEYTLLILSLLHLALFFVHESRSTRPPILPLALWTTPSFAPLLLVLFTAFMSFGIYVWYATALLYRFRGATPIEQGLAFMPVTILGVAAAFLAGRLVRTLPAQTILGAGCAAAAASNTLLAATPPRQTYWAMLFPAMVLAAFTSDLIFAAAQIVASNGVARRHQGAAGSLIGTLLAYGLSTGIGFAGTVESYVGSGPEDIRGLRGAAYLGVGFAMLALVVDVAFVRVPKTDKDGWDQGSDTVEG